jgi:uncharacterized protein YukE
MALTHGMNIGDVENVGRKLQNHYSNTIEQLMSEMESMVNSTSSSWVGPDAEKFRSWWPEKRAALKAIAGDLHGFGQAALNNVQEQRNASGQ